MGAEREGSQPGSESAPSSHEEGKKAESRATTPSTWPSELVQDAAIGTTAATLESWKESQDNQFLPPTL